MSTRVGTMTADELLEMPDDGMRHELVRGELTTMAPPGHEHAEVVTQIGRLLTRQVDTVGGDPITTELGFLIGRDPDTVLAPDAAFISEERYRALGPTRKYWPEAPALAIEVVSPNDTFSEVEAKALKWLDGGCTAVLVVDPLRRTATVYRASDDVRVYRDGDDELDLSDAVPGWRVTVDELLG